MASVDGATRRGGGDGSIRRRRVLVFPLPFQGHINPMLQLAGASTAAVAAAASSCPSPCSTPASTRSTRRATRSSRSPRCPTASRPTSPRMVTSSTSS
ncbi:hypothetical protein EE612_038123 [Oryza sativa]|nr:hypothetical protein EE612_038123 [Oryza sativa]